MLHLKASQMENKQFLNVYHDGRWRKGSNICKYFFILVNDNKHQ